MIQRRKAGDPFRHRARLRKPDPLTLAWTPLEKWVWQKLRVGAIADIDQYEDKHGPLTRADPRKPEDWQDGRRRLSARFLEDLLLREPYCSRLHSRGVNVDGAWFEEEIDLAWVEITRQIWLERCRFEEPVRLSRLRTPHDVTFDESAFASVLELIGAKVEGEISLQGSNVVQGLNLKYADICLGLSLDRAQFNDVILDGARIGGQVSLIGAKIIERIGLTHAIVGMSLVMDSDPKVPKHRSEFGEVALRGARIAGNVSLMGAKITGTLNMDSAAIGGLILRSNPRVSEHRAEFDDIVLRGAKIGGQVSLIGAKVAGLLNLDAADIGQSLFMRGGPSVSEHPAEFDGSVRLIFAKIGGNLDLRGAVLSSLDLTGTRIAGELGLAAPSPQWKDDGKLVLRNASADAIQDTDATGVWPSDLDLDGFTYRRFGGFGADAETDAARRGSGWFIEWLARDEPHTPQPYEQCARVLREMGHPDMANDVLYAGRERERGQAWREGNNPQASGLTLLKWFVGYGYGYRLLLRPLGWAVAIVLLGAFMPEIVGLLPTDVQPDASTWCAEAAPSTCLTDQASGWRLLFSLDMLLPIVELTREHTDLQAGLDGVAYGWFVAQRLFGWVLALFLIAGLTGLTK